MAVGRTADGDLVRVVRELGDLKPDALNALSAIAAAGPHYEVRLLVARTAGRGDAQNPSVYGPANALI